MSSFETREMYEQPPVLLICMWTATALCCVIVLVVTGATIKQQTKAAKAYGFGRQALMRSYGPRTDRVIAMLMVQPCFALTALVQMFLPDLQLLLSLMRTSYFAYAATCFIDMCVLVAGGQMELLANLPSEPIAVWGAPPLCCCFGWSCCKRKVNSWYLQVYMLGVTQFIYVVPVASAFELYFGTSRKIDEDESFLILYALSTLWGLWSIKSMMPPVTQAIAIKGEGANLTMMGHAFLFQIFLTKLPDKILIQVIPRVMKDGWQHGEWSIPPHILVIILESMIICVGTLALSIHAMLTSKHTTYPCSNPEKSYPKDAMAILELNGMIPKSGADEMVAADKPWVASTVL